MTRIYTVRFNVSNSMVWFTGGKIIFNKDNFELKFLGKSKNIVNYNTILEIKKIRKFWFKCIFIKTIGYNVFLIPGFRIKKMIDEFEKLGFNIS